MSPAARDRVVKVKYEVYAKLLRLQSKLQLSLGRRVSFSEVIDRLLAHQEELDPTNTLIGGEAAV
jgi:predicted CopG family antitoxin